MLPLFESGRDSKRIQCEEVANGVLNPVWARNLKEFNPVYAGGIKKLFQQGKG